MPDAEEAAGWRFVRFGLLVTGKGEERFLPRLFRSLMESTGSCQCHFEVIRRIPQLSPITSKAHRDELTSAGKKIPTIDEEIGLAARGYLQRLAGSYVLLIDDLEADRADCVEEVYQRYRTLLDTLLVGPLKHRAAVHFLVNMLEAYYFADAGAVNAATGTNLADHDGDVEAIPHPKGELKRLIRGFDEIVHGEQIVARLDVRHVLSRRETCASLRTLFGWCVRALGQTFTDEYQLLEGRLSPVTRPQIDALGRPASPT